MSDKIGKQFLDLKKAIADYKPGSTLRSSREKSVDLPAALRIGFFGPTGVGKSALINSMNFATGERWQGKAPEGFVLDHGGKTISRDPYFVAENIVIIDNRGMKTFHGPFLTEAARQIKGECVDGQDVEWDPKVINSGAYSKDDKRKCEIHCVVLVVSAVNLKDTAEHFATFIEEMKRLTGQPPIVVVTHRRSSGVYEDSLSRFKADLQGKRIDWFFELENYTKDNHDYDAKKHLLLLEILHQCLIVGDKGMNFKEDKRANGGNPGGNRCTIL